MTRLIFWIGDIFERGVPDDWPLGWWQRFCFNVSQKLYALAVRKALRSNGSAPEKGDAGDDMNADASTKRRALQRSSGSR